ncbi:MAG: zinc-ribbon domain-containing protein [Bryobacteraceae bacterium]|nr:zinc-ribbon domain-containing protein [Bryobacteraceae bacterium]
MPFCTRCGNQVGDRDRFCARCGSKQEDPAAKASAKKGGGDLLASVSAKNAALICYVPLAGWIASIVVLASPRFQRNSDVRFHAFQGLYLFVTWLLVEVVISPFFEMGSSRIAQLMTGTLHLAIFAAQVFMLVQVSQDRTYSLPVVGELAHRSVAEQRQP